MTRNKEGQIQFDHFAINIINNCYGIEDTNQSFEIIGALLDYYEKNPIGENVENIGMPCKEGKEEKDASHGQEQNPPQPNKDQVLLQNQLNAKLTQLQQQVQNQQQKKCILL